MSHGFSGAASDVGVTGWRCVGKELHADRVIDLPGRWATVVPIMSGDQIDSNQPARAPPFRRLRRQPFVVRVAKARARHPA